LDGHIKCLNVWYVTDESTQYSSVDIWLVEDFVDWDASRIHFWQAVNFFNKPIVVSTTI
jgi:hypothetical protein